MDEFNDKIEEQKAEFNSVEPTDTIDNESNPEEVKSEIKPEGTSNTDGFNQSFNPINYTPVKPVNDYQPMSRGLKIFASIMVLVILITGSCFAGYTIGSNKKHNVTNNSSVSVDLAAKPTDTNGYTAAQIYSEVNKSIVGISVYNSTGQGAQASGVIYSKDGYIITNDHIYSEVSSPKFKVYTFDGNEYDAKYVAGDQISDLAVLKIDTDNLTPAEFGNSNELVNGESVVAIGRPSDATQDSSITEGIISSTSRRVKTTSNYSARLIQTDSAINPGSSGGALINMYAQVVGITSSKLAGVDYDAVGYAIPTTTMKRIVEELISKGKVVTRAKLGITYQAVNSVIAEVNGYSNVGLLVSSVSDDSDLSGKVSEGDVITYVNGTKITDDTVMLDVIEQAKAGDTITVTVAAKNGSTTDYNVTLKQNVGESSYTTQAITPSKDNDGSSSDSSGGTFNFPFGE